MGARIVVTEGASSEAEAMGARIVVTEGASSEGEAIRARIVVTEGASSEGEAMRASSAEEAMEAAREGAAMGACVVVTVVCICSYARVRVCACVCGGGGGRVARPRHQTQRCSRRARRNLQGSTALFTALFSHSICVSHEELQ